jgi:hypothetical protein
MRLVSAWSALTARPLSPAARAVRDGLVVAGLLFAGYLFLVVAPQTGTFGFDAYAYWSVDPNDPYTKTAGELGAFPYSPVAARLFSIAGLVPFWVFLWIWTAILVATVIWLGWRSALVVFAFPPVALEIYHGNVHLLMAAAVVIGFRYPAAWIVVLLTKVSPGVGLLWFAARAEWRKLAWALGVTGVVVAISLAVDSKLWVEWISDSLLATAKGSPLNQVSIPPPIWIRLPIAAVIVVWGARTDRAWTVPVAVTLGLPILWPTGFAILAALWPIAQRRPGLTDEATIGRVRVTSPTPMADPAVVQPAATPEGTPAPEG